MTKLKLSDAALKRILSLRMNEYLRGCEGRTRYAATRRGEHVILEFEES